MHDEKFLDRMNRKFGRHAVRRLMLIIVCGMAAVFVLDLLMAVKTGYSFSQFLTFDRAAILRGQVWRILSFIFLPPDSSIVFVVFSLYFYWLAGSALENYWGAFRFDVFYLCGVIGTILSGMITGYATNEFLNLSLFLAFALLYPDFQIMLFFFLPVKIKYLAFLDAAYFILRLIFSSWPGRIALLIAVANVFLFFGGDFIRTVKNAYRRYKYRKEANRNWK